MRVCSRGDCLCMWELCEVACSRLKGYWGCLLFVRREAPCWAQSGVPREPPLTAQSREGKVNKAFKGLIRQNPWTEKEMFNHSLLWVSVWKRERNKRSNSHSWNSENTLWFFGCQWLIIKYTDFMTNWTTMLSWSHWLSMLEIFFNVTCVGTAKTN